MPGPTSEDTSATLLGKLRRQPADAAAWQEFVRRYRPRIYAFCVAWPLQPADAEDVTQVILLKLVDKLRTFHYDSAQSFRGWLRTVSRNVLNDFHAERRRDRGSGDSEVLRLLASVEAREGLVKQLEDEFDQELLDLALRHMQPKVPAAQWEAFRLTALDGKDAAEVARGLSLPVAAVYRAKSKVQQLVREEIRRLEGRAGA